MFPVQLTEAQYLDPATEAHYAVYDHFEKVTTLKHSHEFFELVLVLAGKIGHIVDEQQVVLGPGSLTLVRPSDTHYFQQVGPGSCQLINLAFSAKTMDALFHYLGAGFKSNRLLDAEMPPLVVLSKGVREGLRSRLDRLNDILLEPSRGKRLALRLLLLEIMTRHFNLEEKTELGWPPWLARLIVQMRQMPNFISGLTKMYELASVSPEHLARTFRRYLDKTPTEFVNEIRLGYAANLLIHTDRPIIEVAASSGFESLSHFYRLFSRHVGETPARYRAHNHRSLISLD